ncbi:MAG: DNA polymerase III subunit delta, partial [Flavobacteriales bacterium]|nr:DNA polymerase III subunit delta [Flavobacteriales bacterium]
MRFSEIPGNHAVKKKLIQSVNTGRVSHAQLFLGEEGSASLPLAWAYAQYLSCQNKAEDSCGNCSSCLKFEKMAHPDMHWVFPVTTGRLTRPTSDHFISEFRELFLKNPYSTESQWYTHLETENKQGFIGAAEATDLIKKTSLKPYEGGYKIVLIWHAEKMHTATANKLLKQLEEPPEKTIFILLTPRQEQLLTTIISRLQITKIGALSDVEMRDFLADKNIGAEVQNQAAQLSEGNISEALRLLERDEASEENIKRFQQWMRLSYQANILGVMDWVDEISKVGRERQKVFLQYALHMVRESLVCNFAYNELQRLKEE